MFISIIGEEIVKNAMQHVMNAQVIVQDTAPIALTATEIHHLPVARSHVLIQINF